MRRKTKSLSFSDWLSFLQSPESYIQRLEHGFPKATSVFDFVGIGTHAVAAAIIEEREAVLETQLKAAHAEIRGVVEEQIRQNVAREDVMVKNEKLGLRLQECQLSYFDRFSGWMLRAKPDEIAWADDVRSLSILQVTERKTASILRKKHKQQLFWNAMVLSLSFNIRQPIKLVLRLLGSGTEHVFWYSPHLTQGSLDNVRRTMKAIENYLKKSLDEGVIDWQLEEIDVSRAHSPKNAALFELIKRRPMVDRIQAA